MKQITLLIAVFLGTVLHAQERISPLRYNHNIYSEAPPLTRSSADNDIDSLFLYEYSNIEIGDVNDEFSTNRFEKFDATPADPGVTSELFYGLMNETNTLPLPANTVLCDSSFSRSDTIRIIEGIPLATETVYPFTPVEVWENCLDFYPVAGINRTLFEECYVLIDTLIDGVLDDDQDTVFYNMDSEAFTQDSARVFTKLVTDSEILWTDNYACHNYTFAKNPWSLGVATFDGVDENGFPYEFGALSAHGVADYLTSRKINMAGTGDVYLRFMYQARGYGNLPESIDSLLVEFWNEAEQTWTTSEEWFGLVDEVEPDEWNLQQILVSPTLLQNGFRFRFKNYASLSGALDHWHIDYVSLVEDADGDLGFINDLAITEPINTLLKDYTSVPWDHYKNNTTGSEHMLDEVQFGVYNSIDPSGDASNYTQSQWEVSYGGILQGGAPFVIDDDFVSPDPGNFATGLNTVTYDCASVYAYDPAVAVTQADFDVEVSFTTLASATRNFTNINDTTTFTQRFSNYYAYDDGSAEAAYGVDGTGSLMAYQFEAYESDTLRGILMHFVPSVTDFEEEVFLLTVWSDNDGQPGDIIYQDDFFQSHTPDYAGAKNGFKYYEFFNMEYLNPADSSLTVGEVFYVGWQNIGENSLNIGLDYNIDNGEHVFRNTSGEWLTSSFEISLMIRPVFSTGLNSTLAVDELDNEVLDINLYPNPATNNITLSGLPDFTTVRIYDLSGRVVVQEMNANELDVSFLETGVYLVDVTNEQGESIYSSKLIKK